MSEKLFRVEIGSPDLILGHNQQGCDEATIRKIYEVAANTLYRLTSELTEKIRKELDLNNYAEAFLLLEEAYIHAYIQLRPTIELIDTINKINAQHLSEEQLFKFLNIKFSLLSKLERFDLVEDEDIRLFIQRYRTILDDNSYHSIVLIRANVAAQKGKKELAQALYKQLLEQKDSVSSIILAWAYRGMSLTLDSKDPEFYNYQEMSVYTFLQSGKKIEAAGSLYAMASVLEFDDPDKALEILDEATALLRTDSLIHQAGIASLLHTKARILSRIESYEEALTEVENAIDILRKLVGCEDEILASLKLAAEVSNKLEIQEKIALYSSEIETYSLFITDKVYQLRLKLGEALRTKNSSRLEEIHKEIEKQDNKEIKFLFHVGNARSNPSLSYEDKLEELDKALSILRTYRASYEDWNIVCHACASIYLDQGEESKAIEWYRKTLEYNPSNPQAMQNLASLLWKNEMWQEAVALFEDHKRRFGDLPIILYCYGRSLLEAGRPEDAVQPLLEATQKSSDPHIRECFNRAVANAKKVNLDTKETQPIQNKVITPKIFEESLDRFVSFIQSDKRRVFWELTERRKYDWISSPEKYAQNLLHTFLKAAFGDDVNIFEELQSGAGRLDIYLEFIGSFKAIIELKMCGQGKSKNYALGGLEQLVHYLDNKNTSLGYLIIFDGRMIDFGKGFAEIQSVGKHTIYIKTIDIRPKY